MGDWKTEIDSLFKNQGFEKKLPQLSREDEIAIKEFMDNIGNPAFENICDQLNSFLHVKAELIPTVKPVSGQMNAVELNISKMNQPKLTYRLKFQKKEGGVYIRGEYSIPNIYGENTRFQDTALERLMAGTTEEDIGNDLSDALKSKF